MISLGRQLMWECRRGGEKRIQVENMTVGAVPDYVKMQAAIYADGSTAGVRRRSNS